MSNQQSKKSNTSGAGTANGWESANTGAGGDYWGNEPIGPLAQTLASHHENGVEHVLDIGFGTGRNLEPILDGGFRASGLDISASAITATRARLAARGLDAELVVGDMMDLSHFDSDAPHAIHYFDVLGQVPDPVEALLEARRVLRAGGYVAANLFTPRDSTFGEGEPAGRNRFLYKGTLFCFYEPGEVRQIFKAAGFEIIGFEVESWVDGPHGDYRPFTHEHENTVVLARLAGD